MRAPEIVETIPNIDHRHGDGRAEIIGIAILDEHGFPLHMLEPSSRILVRISVRAHAALRMPNVGFMLRNQLGIDFSGINTAREGYELEPMQAGDIVTVDFYVDLPELYPASFSFSPAIADGPLDSYAMCDWIDNAVTLQMSRSEGEIYGYMHLPCRIEVNAPAHGETRWLSSRASGSSPARWISTCSTSTWRATPSPRGWPAASARSMPAAARATVRPNSRARPQSVMGIDSAADADRIRVAPITGRPISRSNRPRARALPYADGSFDLIVAFEVIEHLADWREFLPEARRALAPNGQFIVSTPNKLYYGESRGAQGQNPFHVHEFEFAEFRDELRNVFPHVSLFLENHVEGVTFRPHEAGNTVEVRVDPGDAVARGIAFLRGRLRASAAVGQSDVRLHPARGQRAARARTAHCVARRANWHRRTAGSKPRRTALAALQRRARKTDGRAGKSNRWAEELNAEVAARGARVVALQGELAGEQERARAVAEGYAAKVAALEDEIREKTQWAIDVETSLKADVARQTAELVKARRSSASNREGIGEPHRVGAQSRCGTPRGAQNRLALYRESRWVKLGRKVGLGPAFPAS